jgi:hypothetical protein
MRFIVSFIFCVCVITSQAAVILDTLYINRGTITVVEKTLQLCVFNETPVFFAQNKTFELNSGDQLLLHVINNDILEHTFTIDGLIETGNLIPGGGDADFFVNVPDESAVRFYSDKPYGHLLGASGLILCGYENYARYYWNFFDQQDTLTDKIDAGTETTIPLDYAPDVFSVNMKVGTELEMDTLTFIMEDVGDTIILVIANSGNMNHNLHFHGFHVTILDIEISAYMTDWIKDSFPVVVNEVMIVRMVPHQDGMYMVHNHNLITTTTNGVYPGGMMSMMMIMP